MMHSIEHMMHLFFDIINKELDRMGVYEVNPTQAILIYNIGTQKLSIGELTSRNIYYGSNVSYSLKKLVITGYLHQTPSPHDKRSCYIQLTSKGMELYERLDQCFEKQAEKLQAVFPTPKAIEAVSKGINALETFLTQNSIW